MPLRPRVGRPASSYSRLSPHRSVRRTDPPAASRASRGRRRPARPVAETRSGPYRFDRRRQGDLRGSVSLLPRLGRSRRRSVGVRPQPQAGEPPIPACGRERRSAVLEDHRRRSPMPGFDKFVSAEEQWDVAITSSLRHKTTTVARRRNSDIRGHDPLLKGRVPFIDLGTAVKGGRLSRRRRNRVGVIAA